MSTILDSAAIRSRAMPISVAQYHRMGAQGILDERTELLQGIVVRKTVKSAPHSYFVERIGASFRDQLPADLLLRQEQPITLADSEPEPDLAIVPGPTELYKDEHPTTALLVAEVAIATEAVDREKIKLYASAGIPECWLVLPNLRTVETFGQPRDGVYTEHAVHTPPAVVATSLHGDQERVGVQIDLGTLFGS